ncbi:MAG: DUF4340 domain-containing protein [Nitrospiraceae bacterium]
MKRYWPTLLMMIALAGLGAYVYLIELPTQRTEERTEIQNKKLLTLEEHDIISLSIQTTTGQVVLAHGTDHRWAITTPIQTDADTREVQSLLRALVTGKITRVVEEQGATLAPFGLEHPSTVITVSTNSQQDTFSIGDTGPLSSTLYVLRGSDQKILLTDMASKDVLNKSLLTFRRKDIVQVEPNQIDRVRLTYPSTEIVLYRLEEKPKPKWKIRFPLEAEADQTEVRALLFRLEDLKALGIIDPGPEHKALLKKLTTPKVKVTVHAAGSDSTIKLYQPDPASGEAFADTKPEGPIYRVNPTAIKDLTKELFTLQDKRLLGVDLPDIAMLSVKTRDEQYLLINQHNEWVLEEKPEEKLNQDAADLFVSRVANLPAEERVIKQAGPLAPYGLVAPAVEFVATGRDGKIIGKLALGSQAGGLVYALGQRLLGIYQVRPDLLTQIPSKRDLLKKSEK